MSSSDVDILLEAIACLQSSATSASSTTSVDASTTILSNRTTSDDRVVLDDSTVLDVLDDSDDPAVLEAAAILSNSGNITALVDIQVTALLLKDIATAASNSITHSIANSIATNSITHSTVVDNADVAIGANLASLSGVDVGGVDDTVVLKNTYHSGPQRPKPCIVHIRLEETMVPATQQQQQQHDREMLEATLSKWNQETVKYVHQLVPFAKSSFAISIAAIPSTEMVIPTWEMLSGVYVGNMFRNGTSFMDEMALLRFGHLSFPWLLRNRSSHPSDNDNCPNCLEIGIYGVCFQEKNTIVMGGTFGEKKVGEKKVGEKMQPFRHQVMFDVHIGHGRMIRARTFHTKVQMSGCKSFAEAEMTIRLVVNMVRLVNQLDQTLLRHAVNAAVNMENGPPNLITAMNINAKFVLPIPQDCFISAKALIDFVSKTPAVQQHIYSIQYKTNKRCPFIKLYVCLDCPLDR